MRTTNYFLINQLLDFFEILLKKKQIKFVYDPKVIGTALNQNQFDKSNLSTICVNYCKVQFKKKPKMVACSVDSVVFVHFAAKFSP